MACVLPWTGRSLALRNMGERDPLYAMLREVSAIEVRWGGGHGTLWGVSVIEFHNGLHENIGQHCPCLFLTRSRCIAEQHARRIEGTPLTRAQGNRQSWPSLKRTSTSW